MVGKVAKEIGKHEAKKQTKKTLLRIKKEIVDKDLLGEKAKKQLVEQGEKEELNKKELGQIILKKLEESKEQKGIYKVIKEKFEDKFLKK